MSNPTTVTVRFATNNTTVTVEVTEPKTVEEIVALAVKQADLPAGIVAGSAFVKNGEDATPTEVVADGDKVDAAPQVRNG